MLEGKIKSIVEKYDIDRSFNKKWLKGFSNTLYDLGVLEDDLLYICPSKLRIVNLDTNKVFIYPGIFALTKDSVVISLNTFLYKKLELVELIDTDVSNISISSPTCLKIKTDRRSYEIKFQSKGNSSKVVFELLKSAIESKNSL